MPRAIENNAELGLQLKQLQLRLDQRDAQKDVVEPGKEVPFEREVQEAARAVAARLNGVLGETHTDKLTSKDEKALKELGRLTQKQKDILAQLAEFEFVKNDSRMLQCLGLLARDDPNGFAAFANNEAGKNLNRRVSAGGEGIQAMFAASQLVVNGVAEAHDGRLRPAELTERQGGMREGNPRQDKMVGAFRRMSGVDLKEGEKPLIEGWITALRSEAETYRKMSLDSKLPPEERARYRETRSSILDQARQMEESRFGFENEAFDLMRPETIKVKGTDGKTKEVEVRWLEEIFAWSNGLDSYLSDKQKKYLEGLTGPGQDRFNGVFAAIGGFNTALGQVALSVFNKQNARNETERQNADVQAYSATASLLGIRPPQNDDPVDDDGLLQKPDFLMHYYADLRALRTPKLEVDAKASKKEKAAAESAHEALKVERAGAKGYRDTIRALDDKPAAKSLRAEIRSLKKDEKAAETVTNLEALQKNLDQVNKPDSAGMAATVTEVAAHLNGLPSRLTSEQKTFLDRLAVPMGGDHELLAATVGKNGKNAAGLALLASALKQGCQEEDLTRIAARLNVTPMEVPKTDPVAPADAQKMTPEEIRGQLAPSTLNKRAEFADQEAAWATKQAEGLSITMRSAALTTAEASLRKLQAAHADVPELKQAYDAAAASDHAGALAATEQAIAKLANKEGVSEQDKKSLAGVADGLRMTSDAEVEKHETLAQQYTQLAQATRELAKVAEPLQKTFEDPKVIEAIRTFNQSGGDQAAFDQLAAAVGPQAATVALQQKQIADGFAQLGAVSGRDVQAPGATGKESLAALAADAEAEARAAKYAPGKVNEYLKGMATTNPDGYRALTDLMQAREQYELTARRTHSEIMGLINSSMPIEMIVMLVMIALAERNEEKVKLRTKELQAAQLFEDLNAPMRDKLDHAFKTNTLNQLKDKDGKPYENSPAGYEKARNELIVSADKAGVPLKSTTVLTQEVQMVMQQYKQMMDMLAAVMRQIQDMIATPIRNIR